MHKSATKCNETIGKWCKNKHGASKIIDTFETYQEASNPQLILNLDFTVPTAETLDKMCINNPPYVDKNRDEVRATPIENIVAAKDLLENNRTPTALDTIGKLMSKALLQ
jgi:hypothetical protein